MATLKELYTALRADGAPMPDSYEKFETYMTSGPNGGYDHRKEVYDALKADGAPLPDTYEQFHKALFAPKKNPRSASGHGGGTQAASRSYATHGSAGMGAATGSMSAVGVSTPKPLEFLSAQTPTGVGMEAGNPRVASGHSGKSGHGGKSYYKLRRGGKDFTVSAEEVKASGGLSGWAAAHPGAPVRVYMQGKKEDGSDFSGHVALSEAHSRRKQRGYKYLTTDRPIIDKPEGGKKAPGKAWKPTPMQKAFKMLSDADATIRGMRESVEQSQRVTRSMTQEGRDEQKAGEMAARVMGKYNKPLGISSYAGGEETETGITAAKSQQSPMVHGVRMVDGELKTEYMLPDGSLTTDFIEADKAEYNARKARLEYAFTQRMRKNGLDPSNPEDVEKQTEKDFFDEREKRVGLRLEENELRLAEIYQRRTEQIDKENSWDDKEGFWENVGRIIGSAARRGNEAMHPVNRGDASLTKDNREASIYLSENHVLNEAKKLLETRHLEKSEGFMNGFWKVGNNMKNATMGARHTASDVDLYGGVMTLQKATQMLEIENKLKAGKDISDAEVSLLYSTMLGQDIARNTDVPHGYTAAQITVEMFPFMAQMMMNPASGLSQALVKKFGKSGLKRIAMTIAGDVAESAVLANTLQAPATISNAIERYQGEASESYDKEGKRQIGFNGDHDWAKAIAKAEGAAVIENYTEMLGEHFGVIKDFAGKWIGKGVRKLGGGKVLDGVTALTSKIKTSDWGKAIGNIEKRAHWNGTIDEVLEEEAGIVLNSIFTGDNIISDLVDADQQIDIVLGVGLFGGFMSGIKTIGYPISRAKAKRQYRQAERVGAFRFGDEWDSIRSEIENAEESKLSETLKKLIDTHGKSQEQSRSIVEYAQALMKARGMDLAIAQAAAEGSITPEQQDAEESFAHGEEIAEAGEPEAMRDARMYLELQRGRVVSALSEDMVREFDADPIGALSCVREPELRRIVADYVNAKQVYDGMIQRVRDDIDGRIAQSDAAIDARVNRDSGKIEPATMRIDDREVYVVSGRVAMFDDGSGVDVSNSSESVIIRDAKTGKVEFVDASEIRGIGEAIEAETEKEAARQQIREEIGRAAADAIDGVLFFGAGETVTVLDGAGNEQIITILGQPKDENGAPREGFIDIQYSDGTIDTMETSMLQEWADGAGRKRAEAFAQGQEGDLGTPRGASEHGDESLRVESGLSEEDFVIPDGTGMIDLTDQDMNEDNGLDNPNRNKGLLPDTMKMPYYEFPTTASRYVESDAGTGGILYRDAQDNDAIVIAALDDNTFVGYFREYDSQGRPTNRWSAKFQNARGDKEGYRDMMKTAQALLPAGHELTEHTSVSTDGLRNLANQLKHGYELQHDEKGNVITERVALNMMARDNELGISGYDAGNIDAARVSEEEFESVADKLLPYMEALGLGRENIYWENGYVYVDHPVLRRAEALTQEQVDDLESLRGASVHGEGTLDAGLSNSTPGEGFGDATSDGDREVTEDTDTSIDDLENLWGRMTDEERAEALKAMWMDSSEEDPRGASGHGEKGDGAAGTPRGASGHSGDGTETEGDPGVPESGESVPNIGENAEISTENRELATENVPNSAIPVENVQETALSRIPVDENTGEPVFEAVDAETAWGGLLEDSADEAEAVEYAEGMKGLLEKEVEKARKKVKNVKVTGDRKKFKADKAAARAELEDAEKRLAHWSEMLSVRSRRASEAEATRRAEASRLEAERRAQAERERAEREEAERIAIEAQNGVPDWRKDTAEAARARGYRMVDGERVERQAEADMDVPEGMEGSRVDVKFDNRNIVDGVMTVIEADELQPSHLDGRANPLFMIPEAQPKKEFGSDRMKSADDMARNMNPAEITGGVTAFTGAPVVNRRMESIQGTGRSNGLRLMWERYPERAAAYREHLMELARRGMVNKTPEEIAAMRQPVNVRMLDVDDSEAIRLGNISVDNTESGGHKRIEAQATSSSLVANGRMGEFFRRLFDGTDEEMSLTEVIRENGYELLQWMAETGIINDTQYKSALSNSNNTTIDLTEDSVADLRKIVELSFFEGAPEGLREAWRSVPDKAQRAILATGYRDYDSEQGMSIRKELHHAVEAYAEMAAYPGFAEARTLAEALTGAESWASQYSFDDRGETLVNREKYSNFAIHLAALFKGLTQKELRRQFNEFYDLVQEKHELSLEDMMEGKTEADFARPANLAAAVKAVFGIDYERKSNNRYGQDTEQDRGVSLAGNSEAGSTGNRVGPGGVDGREREPERGGLSERGAGTEADGGRGEHSDTGDAGVDEEGKGDISEKKVISYHLSDEVDENGRQFVLSSRGSVEFGRIEKESGLTAAPILLSEGLITNPATNAGYGLLHIEARHGDQIRNAGYGSVVEFIEDVAQNYEVIKKGTDREGIPTYMLQLRDKHNNTLMVELSGDGTYWNINTAGIFKTTYGKNREVVYTRHTTDNQPVEADGESQGAEQSDTTTPSSMSTPTLPDGKDNTLPSDKQGKGAESSLGERISEAEQDVDLSPSEASKRHDRELTADDLDGIDSETSGIDENVIDGARDFIEGERTPWSEMCYKTIKEYVRNTGDNRSASSENGDSAQLVESDAEPAGRPERQNGSGSVGMDRESRGGNVSRSGESRQDSSRSGGTISGEEGSQSIEGAPSNENTDNTDSGNTGRSGRAGRSRGDVRKPGGKNGSKRNPRTDGSGDAEAVGTENSGMNAPVQENRQKTGEETAQGMIDDALATIRDIFKNPGMSKPGQLNDVTTLLAGLGVNAVRFLGATAKLGCGLVMKGYYKYARWQGEMHRNLDPLLAEYTDLTDEQTDEFIRAAWEMKMSYRGQRKKISEWAAELEHDELRRLAKMGIAEKRKMQAEAEGTEVNVCDLDNIRETLPFLLPAQHEDVEKAERQFFKPEHSDREHGYGKGYLFTNGTGTGKTYTGLGIAKRFIKQGKGRILIVTVNDTKISDWIKDAKNLGIDATQLPDTKSKGNGVVVTQYANLRQNYALLEDEFDLIIYDESHKLMENQEGLAGSTSDMHHLVAARDAEAVIRRRLETSELGKKLRESREEIKRLNEILSISSKPASLVSDKERDLVRSSGYRSEQEVKEALIEMGNLEERLNNELESAVEFAMADEAQRTEAEAISKNTKTVFLSATPFNTPSSLDYAEGYIFSYPSGNEGTTRQNRKNEFLRKNFGKSHRRNNQGNMVRMSEGQITDPEAVEEEEINFSNYLQEKLHTMSGRMLDSAYDYSRSFPRFDMPEAKLVNAAMSEISRGPLSKFFKKTLLDYNYSTAFWEIIKTGFALPRIKEHIALGRKVVVFHRRKASNQEVNCPFAAGISEALRSGSESEKNAASEFAIKYKELLEWEANLDYTYPQDRILNEFVTDEERAEHEKQMEAWRKKRDAAISAGKRVPPEPKLKSKRVGIFNGDQSVGDKQGAVDNFNLGDQDVIVVQVQSGKEGISLHDTDGKHQRVMMSLALPQSPIEFIQAEGRIYRVGNQSDAIFEYPLLGIDRELYDFAMKINGRSQTSENLAMGAQSRGLRDSITRGALGSTQIPVAEGQGKGGKMLDSRQTQNATGFDQAMSNWKEWQEKEVGLLYDERSIPDPLGFKLMEWAGAERGETVLVGYAGEGSAARYVPSSTKLIALESDSGKLARLAALLGGGGRKILGDVFMTDSNDPSDSYSTVNKADIVVVKTKSGTYQDGLTKRSRSLRDIRKALQHTEDSGRIVAIVPTADLKGVNGIFKMLDELRKMEGCVARTVINLPTNIFGEKSSVIIIDKNLEPSIYEAKASQRVKIQNAISGETVEDSLSNLRNEDVEKREVDRIAKAVKRVKRVLGVFQNSKLVSNERWRGQTQKNMSVNRNNIHIRFTKYLLPESAENLNRLWNGITINFKDLYQRAYLEDIANKWAGCKKLSEMSLDEFKELYVGKFRNDAQYQEALDFMGHLCALIEAATGKTITQLSNIAQGKVENEIKKDMTLSEFQDIYKSLDSGSEELDALAERVFAVAGQIDGLTFKMVDGRVFSGHNVMAHYAPGKNAIELNSDVFNSIRTSDEQKAQCLLHETIHAVSCWALARYKSASAEQRKAMGPIADACKDIEDVFKAINNDSFRAELQAKSKLTDNAMYGLTDEYEMLAEMANPAFRMALKAKRLWRQLVNGIKKLFGIDVLETGEEGTTAFEILNRAIATILNNFDPEAYASYKNNPHKSEHEMRNLFDDLESTDSRNWVQKSLFGEETTDLDSEQKAITPEDKFEDSIDENREEKESEARTEEINARIDEFTDSLSDIYGRYLNIETEDEERQALIEERMNDLISDELLRLSGHLEEYYLTEGNTTEDAHRMARDMASRVLAEATLKLAPEERRKVWNQWNESDETTDTNTLISAGGETVDFTTATSTGILPETPNGFRKLEPGEFCHVERKFTETKEFGFTGAEKIESIDDVAYIFRSLEDYSIENTFVVLVNGGRGTIVHVGMGGPTMSTVDMAAIRGAVDAYGAETLYFVHNHPSGNLRPSPADRAIQQKLVSMFGESRVPDGIIIDVTSGRYSTFGESHGSQTFDKHTSAGHETDSGEKIYPVIRQAKAVRSKEGKQVEQLTIIRSSEDVATFVSEKRLGSGSKINYLLLAQDNSVIGNLHTGFDSYGENTDALADEIVKMATRHGARRVVVYGNVEMQPRELRRLNDNLKRLSGSFVELCDALNIQSRTDYQSAIDMGYAMESDSEILWRLPWGQAQKWSKRRKKAAERQRNTMREKVRSLTEPYGIEVEIREDASGLEGKKRTAKGWFDPRKGKIVIMLGNHSSIADVEATLLHEMVAHKGLRDLFGDKFDAFLDAVWANATDEVKERISQLAARNGWERRVAIEEYLASLAEDGSFKDIKSGWWQKLKGLFMDFLRSCGFSGNVKISDNELRYVLWMSWENLREPGRFRGLLGEAARVAMEYELGVGEYAETSASRPQHSDEDVRYSGGDNVDSLNTRFNNELKGFSAGKLKENHRFELGMPSRYLLSAGFPLLPISMRQALLKKKSQQSNHQFEAEDVRNLVKAIQKPLAIFKYSKDNVRNLIVSLEKDGKHFLVGVTLGFKRDGLEINSISGLFPKQDHEWIKWIQDGKALRIDQKEKVLRLIDSLRINPAEAERIGLDLKSVAKIVKNFENPKIEEGQDAGIRFRDGDFTPRDRKTVAHIYEDMVARGSYQFREAMQDSMLGLKKLYEAILTEGDKRKGKDFRIENVAGYENAYLYENRMSSANNGEQQQYFTAYMKPLLKSVHDLCGSDAAERRILTDYMMAKHGLERNEYMRNEAAAAGEETERDFAGLCGLTGEDDWKAAEAEAQKMVDDYENDNDASQVSELWDNTKRANSATLEKIYLTGLISEDTYNKVLGMYDHYIPLRGWEETTSDEVYGYLTSKDGPLMGNVFKTAEGRESKADDPIATIAMMADDAIRQGNRNVMKQRFLNFVHGNPSDLVSVSELWLRYDDAKDEWEPVFADLEPDMTAAEVESEIAKFEAKMESLKGAEPNKYKKGREAQNVPYKVVRGNLNEHQVLVKRNGRTYVMTINGNPRAAQALNGLTNPDVETGGVIGNMLKAGEYINRHLSAFYTTRNPDFVMSNFLRDMLYSNCMAWVKENPRYALRFHWNFGRVNPVRLRSLLAKWEKGSLSDGNYLERMFKEFMLNGGETGYTSVKDIEGHKRTIAAELKKQGSWGRKAWAALGNQLDLLNRSVENCARFAAFLTSREMGRSLDRSIYDAKEVSVNFNKKGSGGKFVNATGQTAAGKVGSYLGGGGRIAYVFWNAGVQGMTNFGLVGLRNPKKALGGAAALFALGTVIPLLAQLLGGGDGDDDDKNAYYNLPEYVRRSNICFKVGGQWITIPLPIEYRAIYGLGELCTGVMSGNERYGNEELGRQIAGQVSQVLPLDMLEGGGGLGPLIPSAVKPLTEAYVMNKGWTGLPIAKESPFNRNDPEWKRVYQNTDQHLVGLTRWLNETTGGNDYKKGSLDINPAKVEYLLNGTLGGMISFPMKMKKSGETAFGEREFEWRNVPLLNRVVKSGDERTSNRKLKEEYFKYKQEAERTEFEFKGYRKEAAKGIVESARRVDFLYNSDEFLRYQIFAHYEPALKAIRERAKDMPEEAKREYEAMYYGRMRELVNALHRPEEYVRKMGASK